MYTLKFLLALALFACASLFALSTDDDDLGNLGDPHPFYSAEQFASLKNDDEALIGSIVSPIGGQVSLKQTDLVCKGAQSITIDRYYWAPLVLTTFFAKSGCQLCNARKFDENTDRAQLFKHLNRTYKGWVFAPQGLKLMSKRPFTVRITDQTGASLDFRLVDGTTELVSPLYGITNTAGESPSGQHDPRNTRIMCETMDMKMVKQGDHKIVVSTPDGKTLHFCNSRNSYNDYLLEKEVLPNGKILKYSYDGSRPKLIESMDPHERYVYASVQIEGSAEHSYCQFKSQTGLMASYQYFTASESLTHYKANGTKTKQTLTTPKILNQVASPYRPKEDISYSHRFTLIGHQVHNTPFSCIYADIPDQYSTSHLKVKQLCLPEGPDGALIPIYDFDYATSETGCTTTVKHSDGTSTSYHFSEKILPLETCWYSAQGQLHKQKSYRWTDNQWLASVEVRDGQNTLLYQKAFQYDTYGNPIVMTVSGNLTGNGQVDRTVTRRQFSQDGRHLLLREEDDNGKVLRFHYIPHTNLRTAKLTQAGDRIVKREFFHYNDSHNLVCKIEDNGMAENSEDLSSVTTRLIERTSYRSESPFLHMPETVQKSYLADGVEKPLKSMRYTYDPFGNICKEEVFGADQKSAYTLYKTYNSRGELLSETNAIGESATYAYDDKGRCIHSHLFSGLRRDYTYDAQGRLIQDRETGSDGTAHVTSYAYDYHGRVIEETDLFGNGTRYSYGPFGKKATRIESPPILSPEGCSLSVVSYFSYDSLGREIKKTDANGGITTTSYNAYGSPTEITYPDGSREIFRYSSTGRLQSQQDKQGLTTLYEHDMLGRVTSKTYVAQEGTIAKETFTYDAFALLSETDREGNQTNYTYDGAGRLLTENRSGQVTRYSYSPLGDIATITQENGTNSLVTAFDRDLLGRVLHTLKSDLAENLLYQTSQTYDAQGNIHTRTRYIDDTAATETFVYDSWDRLIEYTDALGNKTDTCYEENYPNDLAQRVLLKRSRGPDQITHEVLHDAYQREIREENFDATHQSLSCQDFYYDPMGNLLQRNDKISIAGQYKNTQLVRYTYTKANQVQTCTRAYNTPQARQTNYTYRPSGQLATKTKPDGVRLTYEYDSLGYLKRLSSSDGLLSLTYIHNRLGHLIHAIDDRNDNIIDREVDPFGNVLIERFAPNLQVEKSYDLMSRLLALTIPSHMHMEYTYDPLFLRSVAYTRVSDGCMGVHSYDRYDLDGNLTSETLPFQHGSISRTTDLKGRALNLQGPYFSQHCDYDSHDNLTHSRIDNSLYTYRYDPFSQLTSESEFHFSKSYQHDSNYNRVRSDDCPCSINDLNEMLTDEGADYRYDANGNLIERLTPSENISFAYDPLNRLIATTTPDCTVEMTYDPIGRRVSKVTHTEDQETTCEYYLYHGENEIGAFTSDGRPKQLRGLGLALHKDFPNTILMDLDGNLVVPLLDCQGNVRRLWDPPSKSIVGFYDYSAFGCEIHRSEQARFSNPWRYASKRIDSETGLINFGKRYYYPLMGRWLTTDPAGFVDGTNLYSFLLNNPFRYVDPDGRFVIALPLIIWGGAAGLSWVLPSLTTIAITATVLWGFQEICMAVDQMTAPTHVEFPGTPDELVDNPDWKEVTRPEAKENGHRTFENKKTGRKVRYDKGKPNKTGHRARDHYHIENPNKVNDKENAYLDKFGNACERDSPESHLYPPEGINWGSNFYD